MLQHLTLIDGEILRTSKASRMYSWSSESVPSHEGTKYNDFHHYFEEKKDK